jgi:hypothetical protein
MQMIQNITRGLLLTLALALLLTGCTAKSEPNTIKDGGKLSDVMAHVDLKFEEKYGSAAVPGLVEPIDDRILADFYGLDAADVTDMAGGSSMLILNSDTLVGLKAAEGKLEQVIEALNRRKADLEAQYEFYNVSGSYDRALAGEVYQRGGLCVPHRGGSALRRGGQHHL